MNCCVKYALLYWHKCMYLQSSMSFQLLQIDLNAVSAAADHPDNRLSSPYLLSVTNPKLRLCTLYSTYSYWWWGAFIWLLHGHCKLVSVASLFRMLPTPSQALFPSYVTKKCYSVGTPNSSLWHLIFHNLFLHLYWATDPSQKQTSFKW